MVFPYCRNLGSEIINFSAVCPATFLLFLGENMLGY